MYSPGDGGSSPAADKSYSEAGLKGLSQLSSAEDYKVEPVECSTITIEVSGANETSMAVPVYSRMDYVTPVTTPPAVTTDPEVGGKV